MDLELCLIEGLLRCLLELFFLCTYEIVITLRFVLKKKLLSFCTIINGSSAGGFAFN